MNSLLYFVGVIGLFCSVYAVDDKTIKCLNDFQNNAMQEANSSVTVMVNEIKGKLKPAMFDKFMSAFTKSYSDKLADLQSAIKSGGSQGYADKLAVIVFEFDTEILQLFEKSAQDGTPEFKSSLEFVTQELVKFIGAFEKLCMKMAKDAPSKCA